MIEDYGIRDIGPSILLHLTRGLYPDARDVLREYLQNAVDSKASKSAVVILDDAVVIEDDGDGMSLDELRDSVRLALSHKNPATNVGYKGIGMYSALNVADRLVLRSAHSSGCHELIIELKSIRDRIESLGQDHPGDLTKILGEQVTIRPVDGVEHNALGDSKSTTGTQVRLESISPLAKLYYSDQDKLSAYFDRTIPLAFHPDFVYGEAVTRKISEYCEAANQSYRTIELTLTVAARSRDLYRPYLNPPAGTFDPVFHDVSIDLKGELRRVGLVWACLHKNRRVIPEGCGCGVLLKKHGFTIGTEETAMRFFKQGKKFFNRYMGEIILLSPDLAPNAARDNLEYGEVSEKFNQEMKEVALQLESVANRFQENSIAMSDVETLKHDADVLMGAPSEQGILKFEQFLAEVVRLRLGSQLKYLEDGVVKEVKRAVKSAKSTINDVRKKFGGFDIYEEVGEDEAGAVGVVGSSNDAREGDAPEQASGAGGKSSGAVQKENRGLPFSQDIQDVLNDMNAIIPEGRKSAAPVARKIKSLYESLCNLSFRQHGVLAYVGTWVLWEILGKVSAKDNEANAYNTLNQRIAEEYVRSGRKKQTAKDVRNALDHIQSFGDANKHSLDVFAQSGVSLKHDMEVLHDFMLMLLVELRDNIRSGVVG